MGHGRRSFQPARRARWCGRRSRWRENLRALQGAVHWGSENSSTDRSPRGQAVALTTCFRTTRHSVQELPRTLSLGTSVGHLVDGQVASAPARRSTSALGPEVPRPWAVERQLSATAQRGGPAWSPVSDAGGRSRKRGTTIATSSHRAADATRALYPGLADRGGVPRGDARPAMIESSSPRCAPARPSKRGPEATVRRRWDSRATR